MVRAFFLKFYLFSNLFSIIASKNGHENDIKLLLSYKADPNTKDQFGNTLLHKGKT
jgi:hypothetical protein